METDQGSAWSGLDGVGAGRRRGSPFLQPRVDEVFRGNQQAVAKKGAGWQGGEDDVVVVCAVGILTKESALSGFFIRDFAFNLCRKTESG